MKKKNSLWLLMMILAVVLAFGGCSDNGSVPGDNEDTQKEQRDLDRDGEGDDRNGGKQEGNKQEDDKQEGNKQEDDKQEGNKQEDGKQEEGKQEDGKQGDSKQEEGKQGDDKKAAQNDSDSEDQHPGSTTEDRKAQGSEENRLVGTWVSDPIDALARGFMVGMGDLGEYGEYLALDESKLIMRYRFVFDENGNVSASIDEKSYNETMVYVVETMEAGTKRYIEDTLKNAGLDMSVDEFMEMLGTTWDEFNKETREEAYSGIDTDSEEQVSVYEVRDGRIFMAGTRDELENTDSVSFEVSGDVLTLIAYYDVDGELVDDSVWGGILEMPIVFHRQ